MKQLSENSIRVLEERYLVQDHSGKVIETPEEMFLRVAKKVASAELKWGKQKDADYWEGQFFRMMSELDFLPNSTTLMNAGTGYGQLSACFVLPVRDSLSGIFDTLKMAALVQQKGGGTGFNFSKLRPKGDRVSKHGGTSSGPVSFLELFNFSSDHVKQGGKRLGANMGIMNVDHPDIFEFMRLGSKENRVRHFNLSVGITDQFMKHLETDKPWSLINPRTQKVLNKVSPKAIWEELIFGAWESGNPGVIFLDTINSKNPTPNQGEIQATNPCGEVPLLPYESCNLGSINLTHFIKSAKGKSIPDWERIGEIIPMAVRFLDNVIEVNHFPNSKIKKATLSNRKIGLGVMGWADFLIQLGIPYGSQEAVDLGEELMRFINEKSHLASQELAKKRGSFPNWEESVFAPHTPIRNATLTSIAPTGTISLIANTSSSIEPLFALAFERRNVLGEETLQTIQPQVLNFLQEKGLLSEELKQKIAEDGTCADSHELSEKDKAILQTATEIDPIWHLKHQVAFQKFTDNAVSKTINLPASTKPEDIGEIYLQAWKEGVKGLTVFRTDSGREQMLYPGLKTFKDKSFPC
ncbi:adenosylcobalamin-dependent ribonucleoside-diphosphate reductase [Algoriphagus kandeliae]|uniref:Vitamin B12-dependent ribonucleotide reductase n=1 Tax=Algoriphagus kandeliae TaxID=2562278 RepID=A0A4Y9QTM5_9BACT|nr:adenosylcobalamin-dependent ribonucleoside-diphosphate reductase [Algoriphagus kandeliae]TFV94553.1 adenosylcobalamin-dependent ribonucleoside-diphosphate reductase [Algoriphagus kandeliae]